MALFHKHVPDATNPRDTVGELYARDTADGSSRGMIAKLFHLIAHVRRCMAHETLQLMNSAQADNYNQATTVWWKYTTIRYISDSCYRLDPADLSKIYLLKAGIYRLSFYQEVTIQIAGEGISAGVHLSGSFQVGSGVRGDTAGANGDRRRVHQSVLIRAEAGDYLQLAFSQTAGTTGTITASNNQGQLNLERIE